MREAKRARAWLFTILRNAYLHKVRDRKTIHVLSMEEVGDIPDRLPDPLPAIDPQLLQQALDELAEPFRTPIILYYFEDFSYRDIADQLEVPIGTVMSRLRTRQVFFEESPRAHAGNDRRRARWGECVMDCTNAHGLLPFLRTGELDATERDVLESHVSGCPECLASVQAESRFDDAIEVAMARVPMPAGLKGRLLVGLARRRPTRRWPWVAAAALLAMAGLGGYVVWSGGPEEFDVAGFSWYVDYRTPLARDSRSPVQH